jgi:hypothetical protein
VCGRASRDHRANVYRAIRAGNLSLADVILNPPAELACVPVHLVLTRALLAPARANPHTRAALKRALAALNWRAMHHTPHVNLFVYLGDLRPDDRTWLVENLPGPLPRRRPPTAQSTTTT